MHTYTPILLSRWFSCYKEPLKEAENFPSLSGTFRMQESQAGGGPLTSEAHGPRLSSCSGM